MKFFALKDIPNGTPAGRLFEATEDEGRFLISFGIARQPTEAELAGAPVPAVAQRSGRHHRRDMRAED